MLEFLTDWLQRLLRQPAKLMYIGGSDTLPPPLTKEREAELLVGTTVIPRPSPKLFQSLL